jgi:hypothetical protein
MAKDDSLASINELIKSNKALKGMLKRVNVESYDDFVEVLHEDLLIIIRGLEKDRASFHGFSNEDHITNCIKRELKCLGYSAIHDSKDGGHVDLIVEQGVYEWKAEAKIARSLPYVLGAIDQIDTYTTFRDSKAGILIYNIKSRSWNF